VFAKLSAIDFDNHGMNETGFKSIVISVVQQYYPEWIIKSEYMIEIHNGSTLKEDSPKLNSSGIKYSSKDANKKNRKKEFGFADLILFHPTSNPCDSPYDVAIILEFKYWRLPYLRIDEWTNEENKCVRWNHQQSLTCDFHPKQSRKDRQIALSSHLTRLAKIWDERPSGWLGHISILEQFGTNSKSVASLALRMNDYNDQVKSYQMNLRIGNVVVRKDNVYGHVMVGVGHRIHVSASYIPQ
jgi:hypothetical protein